MVYRIIAYILFGMLVVAFVLSFVGITEIYIGDGFTNWLRFVTSKFDGWSFKIPGIPNIKLLPVEPATGVSEVPLDANSDGTTTLAEFFGWLDARMPAVKQILNVIIGFFNFIINVVNFLIRVLNIFIQVVQFVLTMVYCIKELPTYLNRDNWARWNNEETIWWWKNLTFVARTIV